MSRLKQFAFRLRALFRRETLDADMAEEMRLHLELRTQRNIEAGIDPQDAQHAAQRSFGGVEQTKERARDVWSWAWVEHLSQDLRYGIRTLVKDRAFALTAILTLTLGIGGTTAFFTVIDAVVLKPLPVRAPGELVMAARVDTQVSSAVESAFFSFSYPLYEQLRVATPEIVDLAAMGMGVPFPNGTLAPGGLAERVYAYEVTGNFFSVVGVQPAFGRLLGPEDDHPGDPRQVVVLAYHYWVRRFGSDPGAIGRTILLDDIPCTIVGVAAKSFTGMDVGFPQELWMPLQVIRRFDPVAGAQRLNAENMAWLKLVGRLAPQGSRQRASVTFNAIYQRQAGDAASALGTTWATSPQRRYFDGHLELIPGARGFNQAVVFLVAPIRILAGLVSLVLLMAVVSVAGLIATRAANRYREFALRGALGAGRSRLVRQLLTESLLLSIIGGAAGLVLARWALDLLIGEYIPAGPLGLQKSLFNLNPDGRVFAFVTTISVAAGMLVTLVPALGFGRLDLVSALKGQGPGATGGMRPKLGKILIVAQLTIAVCLVAGSAMLVRTLQNLRNVELGFDRVGLSQVRVDIDRSTNATRRAAAVAQILAGASSLPGVDRVSATEAAWGSRRRLKFDVDAYIPAPGESLVARPAFVGSAFFETWRIPVRKGRGFRPEEAFSSDGRDTAGVAVISESLALRYFGTTDPIGQRLRPAGQAPVDIIGVVGDVNFEGARSEAPVVIYLPLSRSVGRQTQLIFQIRTFKGVPAPVTDFRRLVAAIGSDVHVFGLGLEPVESLIESQLGEERTIAKLASIFGAFALVLACVGLYGSLAHNVGSRTREIGIRMALGAVPGAIAKLVIGQGIRFALAGCAFGIVGAFALMRLARSWLFGVTPADPVSLILTMGALVTVAFFASWLPARRAAKVDPMVALRCE